MRHSDIAREMIDHGSGGRPDRVDAVLETILSLDAAPAPAAPRRLAALFRELGSARPDRDADTIEEMIWAIWISHRDDEAAARMIAACEAIAAGAHDLARPILDEMVTRWPDWPEAWNKRATLAFIERRDEAALDDIARTLALEPRHFGAVSGFGQICLRRGRWREAAAAFTVALRINPHLRGLREALDEIAACVGRAH